MTGYDLAGVVPNYPADNGGGGGDCPDVLTIDAGDLPDGQALTAYTPTAVTATGGTEPYAWSAVGLPDGLTIDATSGEITGTPVAQGDSIIRVGAAGGGTAWADKALTIAPPPDPGLAVLNAMPGWWDMRDWQSGPIVNRGTLGSAVDAAAVGNVTPVAGQVVGAKSGGIACFGDNARWSSDHVAVPANNAFNVGAGGGWHAGLIVETNNSFLYKDNLVLSRWPSWGLISGSSFNLLIKELIHSIFIPSTSLVQGRVSIISVSNDPTDGFQVWLDGVPTDPRPDLAAANYDSANPLWFYFSLLGMLGAFWTDHRLTPAELAAIRTLHAPIGG